MGVLARDELYLNVANGSLAKSKVVFGCAYDQQGLLLNTLGKTDGILGLSRAKISLPSQLASQGIIKNVVGHCLAADARGGGYLFLGDDFVPYWQMAWVPMLQSYDLNVYQTNIVKVSYGSRQIGLGNVRSGQGRLVFDTGSSYSYFTDQAYNNLVTMFDDISSESLVRDMSDTSLPICWRAKSPLRSVDDVRQFFKPLNLQFGSKWWIVSTKLQIPPEGYLVVNRKGNVCLGILNGREVNDGSTFILGDISLRGLLFVYDNVKEKIGWVRSDCARPRRFVSDTLY
ncbi:Aspartyl protease APCB1 [Sesamum alatum]|uniref:Aspartyl protease APCB1 n=1 Tax=Sesamum alatum TaxID=300844 RepID=A0AAE2CLL3_9LAMI|nr:Aspartyl protease APCB1 [Sesamum alatum]